MTLHEAHRRTGGWLGILLFALVAAGCAQVPARPVAADAGAQAAGGSAPRSAVAGAAECAEGDAECVARKQREEEEAERRAASTEGAAGLVFGGGSIVPCVGTVGNAVCGDTGPAVVTRGPLTVRRLDVSVGIDHALSPQWVVGGLVGLGRGRVHRVETVSTQAGANTKETTIRTRNATLAALLTWYPQADVSVDGSISLQRAQFDFDRFDSLGQRRFIGDNAGRGWSAALSASKAWRGDGVAFVPQAGLLYVDSRIDPLQASIPTPPPDSIENFRVAEQRAKVLSSLVEAQVQWPRSRSFGVVAPYARAAWRQRLAFNGDPVLTRSGNGQTTTSDIEAQTARSTGTLAAGVLAVLPQRISLFGDVAYTRGSGNLREARLSLGVKFER